MKPKDIVESVLAIMVVATVCWLAISSKIEAATIVALGMYVIKKFMDGISDNKEA